MKFHLQPLREGFALGALLAIVMASFFAGKPQDWLYVMLETGLVFAILSESYAVDRE